MFIQEHQGAVAISFFITVLRPAYVELRLPRFGCSWLFRFLAHWGPEDSHGTGLELFHSKGSNNRKVGGVTPRSSKNPIVRYFGCGQ